MMWRWSTHRPKCLGFWSLNTLSLSPSPRCLMKFQALMLDIRESNDIWALGITALHLLTGELPYECRFERDTWEAGTTLKHFHVNQARDCNQVRGFIMSAQSRTITGVLPDWDDLPENVLTKRFCQMAPTAVARQPPLDPSGISAVPGDRARGRGRIFGDTWFSLPSSGKVVQGTLCLFYEVQIHRFAAPETGKSKVAGKSKVPGFIAGRCCWRRIPRVQAASFRALCPSASLVLRRRFHRSGRGARRTRDTISLCFRDACAKVETLGTMHHELFRPRNGIKHGALSMK